MLVGVNDIKTFLQILQVCKGWIGIYIYICTSYLFHIFKKKLRTLSKHRQTHNKYRQIEPHNSWIFSRLSPHCTLNSKLVDAQKVIKKNMFFFFFSLICVSFCELFIFLPYHQTPVAAVVY